MFDRIIIRLAHKQNRKNIGDTPEAVSKRSAASALFHPARSGSILKVTNVYQLVSPQCLKVNVDLNL